MSDPIESTQGNGVNQADYLKLYMQELTYQDPLKPMDNSQFMAQMAQFSALQEAQKANGLLQFIGGLTNANLSLALLGKKVTIKGNMEEGTVNRIEFLANEEPNIEVLIDGKNTPIKLRDLLSVY